jgi:superfamily I DNA/RNA helicase
LLDLSRKAVLENRGAFSFETLPEHIVDEVILAPAALGRSVVDEFLAGIMLQHSSVEDQPHAFTDGDRVTISTIHRAKGLEWSDVYVPYLNEGFLPSSYIDDGAEKNLRHVTNCDALVGRKCDKDCAAHFANIEAKDRGGPDERHLNEERRISHVASTRAKEKLVFLSVDEVYSEGSVAHAKKSSFLNKIRHHVTIVNKKV